LAITASEYLEVKTIASSNRVTRYLRRKYYGPHIKLTNKSKLMFLGSTYGGWVFEPNESLHESTILSCGLGEDASFDVEIARLYRSRVVMVDPTPRAINHFDSMMRQIGSPSTVSYSNDGIQSIESYDLSELDASQFSLIQAALSDRVGFAKFFSPPNPLDVSHSLVNFQNDYSSTTPYINVPTVDIKTLIFEQDLGHISIAKFDIEGAEIEVIPLMLRNEIFPDQILVEYDELNFPSARARDNFNVVNNLIQEFGYEMIWFDGRTCVSYRRGIL